MTKDEAIKALREALEQAAFTSSNCSAAEYFQEVLSATEKVEDGWRPLSIDEAELRLHQAISNIKFVNKTDDKLIISELRKMGCYIAAPSVQGAAQEQE